MILLFEFNIDENKIIDDLFDPLLLEEIDLWHFKCDIVEDENDKTKSRISNLYFKFKPYRKMLDKLDERTIFQENPYIKDDELIYIEKEIKIDGKKKKYYDYIPLEGIGSFFILKGYIF